MPEQKRPDFSRLSTTAAYFFTLPHARVYLLVRLYANLHHAEALLAALSASCGDSTRRSPTRCDLWAIFGRLFLASALLVRLVFFVRLYIRQARVGWSAAGWPAAAAGEGVHEEHIVRAAGAVREGEQQRFR